MTVAPTRWVSCGKKVEPGLSDHRHLTKQLGDHTFVETFCGALAQPGVLLTNSTKPRCPECIEKAGRNTLLRGPRRSARERKQS